MKKCKRLISLALSVLMLLSFGAINAGAAVELSDVDPNSLVGKAISELIPLGIIDGYPDGTFRQDNTITRAEFAKVVVTFMNLTGAMSDALPTGFEDVDSIGHWGKPYIQIAASQGVIAGYLDGTFAPDSPVKYSEAVKMMVCAMGYGEIAVQRTPAGAPWYTGYIAQAAELGMLNNVTTSSQEEPASRGAVAILLYNSLTINVATVTVLSDGTIKTVISDTSAITKYHNSERLTGVVVACAQTGLYSKTTEVAGTNVQIKVGGETKNYTMPAGTDTYSYLGKSISFLVSENTVQSQSPSITDVKVDARNTVLTLKPDDIDSVSASSLSYWASENASRTTSARLSSDMSVIYNGRYLSPWTPDKFEIDSGTVQLICNNGDGVPDVAIIDSYDVVVALRSGTEGESKKIYAKYGAADVTIPTSAKVINVYVSGSTTPISDPQSVSVSANDVLNVKISEDNEVFEMYVTRNTKSGTITETSSGKIVVGGTEYTIGKTFAAYSGADKPALSLSSSVKIYLDYFGEIAGAEQTSTAATNAFEAFLIYAEKESGVDGVGKISTYGFSGSASRHKVFTLAKRVTIDGTQYNDYAAMITALGTTAATANEGKKAQGLTPTAYSQFVRFTLNTGGQVDSIDTIAANVSAASDDITCSVQYPSSAGRNANGEYKYDNRTFYNTSDSAVMNITASTKVLMIPEDFSDTTGYSVKSASYFIDDKYYAVEGYNANAVKNVEYILIYGSQSAAELDETSPIVLASAVSEISGSNSTQDKVTGWRFDTNAAVNNLLSENAGLFKNTIDPGEIFRYAANGDGEAEKIEMVLEIENKKPVLLNGGGNLLNPASKADDAGKRTFQYDEKSASQSTSRLIYGTVMAMDDSMTSISVTNVLYTDSLDLASGATNTFDCTNAKVYCLDLVTTNSNNLITESDIAEAIPYDKLGTAPESDASQVLIFTSQGNVKSVLIIKQ